MPPKKQEEPTIRQVYELITKLFRGLNLKLMEVQRTIQLIANGETVPVASKPTKKQRCK